MAYIYQITNDINNKIYIGKTEFDIQKRFKEHCQDAFKERNEKRPLYSAMRKYGIEHFHIELIEETDNPEERETFWIEQKQSFKYGYNATLGGDGKKYIDYDLVVETYKELQSISDTAKILSISTDSVSLILNKYNISIKSGQQVNAEKFGKIVNMYSKETGEYIQTFPSCAEAARYLIENNKTNCKPTTIRYHITEVCNNKRKSAAGYIWKYPQNQE